MKMSSWKLIKEDIDRYVSNPDYRYYKFPAGKSILSYIGKLLILFFRGQSHCFRVLLYYRLGKWSRLLKLFFRMPYGKTTSINCPDVAGGGIFFSHAWGTVLNCEHIGYGCAFLQNTTFGNKRKNGKLVRPWLGDRVIVGANVVCIGGVHIGNNVRIGAGAVVAKDVPDNCTVVGNPARIILKDGERVNIPL